MKSITKKRVLSDLRKSQEAREDLNEFFEFLEVEISAEDTIEVLIAKAESLLGWNGNPNASVLDGLIRLANETAKEYGTELEYDPNLPLSGLVGEEGIGGW